MDKRTKFNAGKKDRVKLKRELVVKEALAESSQVEHIASNNEFIKDKRSKREGKIDKKDLVKSKKRKLAEKEVMVEPSQVDHINSDEFVKGEKLIEVKTEKKKKNKSGKKKRKTEKDSSDEVRKVYQPPSECEDGPELSKRVQVAESKESDIQTWTESSTRPQKLNGKENRNTVKSKNAKKMKGQFLSVTDSRSNVSSENVASEIYHISSGDEDSSKGMKKWIKDYHQSRPGLEILQEKIDQFMTAHEEQEEQARKERESRAAEGGWTVVTRLKGRKKTTDAESGITVGSIAAAAVVDKMTKKKSKDIGIDFYRFQRREAHRNEIMMLQSKYEQDKKRIQELRAARKFRPY